MSRRFAVAIGMLLAATMSADPARAATLPFRVISDDPRGHGRHDGEVARVFQIEETDLRCETHEVTLLVSSAGSDVGWSVARHTRAGPTEQFVLRAPAGAWALIVSRCPEQASYAAHGPFRWRSAAGRSRLATDASRTIQVRTDAPRDTPLQLVGPSGQPYTQGCLLHDDGMWECVGVPSAMSVLVLLETPEGLEWGVAARTRADRQIIDTETASWGQLVSLGGAAERQPAAVDLRLVYQPRPAGRAETLRPLLVAAPEAQAHRLGEDSWWLVGGGPVVDRFVEVRGPSIAVYRQDLRRVVTGLPSIPFRLQIRSGDALTGVVTGDYEQPVANALVSIFEYRHELVELSTGDVAPVRHWVLDTWSDRDGRFFVDGLVGGRHEVIAVHPSRGRAVLDWLGDARPLRIRLQPAVRARGRVLADGLPAPGRTVRVVPDRLVFEAAIDPAAITAPRTQTDRFGQFELALPDEGGGDVIVGGAGGPTVRISYPDASRLGPTLELGDIDLPPPVEVRVRLWPGCDLRAVGPIGKLGLTAVSATLDLSMGLYRLWVPEIGSWWVEAMCPGVPADLTSRLVSVADRSPVTVDLSVGRAQPR